MGVGEDGDRYRRERNLRLWVTKRVSWLELTMEDGHIETWLTIWVHLYRSMLAVPHAEF